MPPQKNNKKYRRGFKKWADEKALSIRKKMGIYASGALDAFDLCQYLEIPLLIPTDIPGITDDILNQLMVEGSSNWSAATVPLSHEEYLIVHNPTHSNARQQSNIMHEIAHILCGHEIPTDKIIGGLSGFLRNYDEIQENEAEWLGSCLQLPRPALLYSLKSNLSEQEIAMKYNASPEMTRFRINATGVKRQLQYQRKK